MQTHPFLWFYDNGVFIFFRHKNTGGEGRLQHVRDQIIREDIQLLDLIARHIGRASDAIARGKRTMKNKPRPPENVDVYKPLKAGLKEGLEDTQFGRNKTRKWLCSGSALREKLPTPFTQYLSQYLHTSVAKPIYLNPFCH